LKISVALAYSLGEPLTYRAPDGAVLQPGDRVVVPLGRRLALGWVVGLDSPYNGRLKSIVGIIADPFRPGPELMEFARQAAAAYFTSPGSLLDLSLPPGHKNIKALQLETDQGQRQLDDVSPSELERLAAAGPLRLAFKKPSPAVAGERAAAAVDPAARLLLGPGRDHAYRDACAEALAAGGSVILVTPDIATARYWQDALPGVDPFHSGVTPAARERTWRQYRQGKSGIVCGGLAALALPLARPALLILDRAASPLYRRQGASPFRVDHLAEIRAATAGMPLLRGADSHTCATYAGRDHLAIIDGRQERGITCRVHMLKGRERGIPAEIVDLVRDRLLAGRKTLVLVNRIQPVVHLFCPACGRVAACPRCGAPLGKLQIDGEDRVSCRRCPFRREALAGCPRCGKPLEPLHDISIDSLARALERVCGEAAVLALTAAELKDPAAAIASAAGHAVVVATLAALSPHFAGLFGAAVWVKPESFFGMEDHDAAELIHGCGAEIAATLAPGGELHVFSVFHFHFALQHLLDEAPFFARELKYRQWFLLPPYAAVYELELRAAGLRPLAAAMRELLGRHGRELNVRRAYLASRQPQRGSYRGILELHAQPERIAAAGLHRLRRSALRRVAG
jgi:primosomal protein N'